MNERLRARVPAFDLMCFALVLVTLLALPVFFIVPFLDDWLRISFVEEHGVWSWVHTHAREWVVRPFADLLLAALASLATNKRGDDATAHQLLMGIRAGHFVCIGLFALLIAVQAYAFRHGRNITAELSLLCCLWLIVLFTSDNIAPAFYWPDGYANILLPFMLITIGMASFFRSDRHALLGTLGLSCAALGHEVMCIFTLGFAGLTLALRGSSLSKRQKGLLFGLLSTACVLLFVQLFSHGPERRTLAYAARTGARYNLHGALSAMAQINVPLCLLAFISTLFAISTYRDHLGMSLERALRDQRDHRLYWMLLSVGAASTALVPFASVGLTKHALIVSYYGVATILFVVLSAAIAYPFFAPYADRLTAWSRRKAGSVLPIVFFSAALSPNLSLLRDAMIELPRLTNQAELYIEGLKQAEGFAIVCRPAHPFGRQPSKATGRVLATYFGLRKVKEKKCPNARATRERSEIAPDLEHR